MRRVAVVSVIFGMFACLNAAGGEALRGHNLLPNADFSKVKSGYWPDW